LRKIPTDRPKVGTLGEFRYPFRLNISNRKSITDAPGISVACKGEGETLCNFDYSGALIEHNLLGSVAHRAGVGESFDWDAEKFKITNDEAANALLSKTYRKGWAPA